MKLVGAVLGTINQAGNFAKTCYDEVTGNVCVIGTEHHEIHEGEHFTAQHLFTGIGVAGNAYVLLTTPDTSVRVHIIFRVVASKNGTIYFYEGPDITASGTAMTEFNNDRNSASAATMVVTHTPTIGAGGNGSQLLVNVVGTDGSNPLGNIGGILQRGQEFVLKQNEQYLIRFNALTATTRCSICCEWYEEGGT
jgi:hypothetical protein